MPVVPLAYDDSGGEGRPIIVFVHGLSSARTTWAGLVPALAAEHRVVSVDLRGHGDSPHADAYVLEHYARDLIALCDEVVGEPAVFVGHSLGGVVTAYVCQQRPDLVAGAVLEDPPLYVFERPHDAEGGVQNFFPMMRQLFRQLGSAGAPLEQYEAVVRAAPALDGSGRTMADVLGPAGTTAQAQAWRGLDPEVLTPAIEGHALHGVELEAPLGRPVAVLRADPALGPAFSPDDEQQFLAANPDCAVAVVEGASHAIHDEQPDVVLAAVQAMVARLQGA